VNSADPIVEMRDVSVRVGSTQILRRVDLDIAAGEAVGLFGGNGAGKTTLLRVLATLLRPDGGRAVVLGADLATAERLDVRHRIGLIGHTPALYPELTLAENLGFAAEIAGIPVAAVAAALATVGLAGAADREAAVCSYGMQRRAEYARELMLQPDLLLLDEPHSALDTASADLVAHLTDEVVARGGAAVLVSHDRDRVEKLVGRSLELSGGTVT
jgi:heme ABC exporter ATP-binding subunit CcmA